MKLLTDEEIVARLHEKDPFILGIKESVQWYVEDSPVGPASVGLTIGNILVPSESPNVSNDSQNGQTMHSLEPGGTVVIVTEQELRFPGNIAGLAMPKSHTAFQGIMITNPGFIDPGYWGRLRFTLINMGRKPFALVQGAIIIKLLILELSDWPNRSWHQRTNSTAPDPTFKDVKPLTRDFLDIKRRATKIARNEVWKQSLIVGTLTTIFITIFVVVLGFIFNQLSTLHDTSLSEKVISLEETNTQLKTLPADVSKLASRVDKLEQQGSSRQVNTLPSTSKRPVPQVTKK